MNNKKILHAEKAIRFCQRIKDGIKWLCEIIDIADDTFCETDRISDYKNIFHKADSWQKQYENYLKENTDNE